MKRFTFIVMIAIAIILQTNGLMAQTKWMFGIKTGVNITRPYIPDEKPPDDWVHHRLRGLWGGLIKYTRNPNLSFVSGIGYKRIGFELREDLLTFKSHSLLTLDYVYIPLALKIKLGSPKLPFLSLGLEIFQLIRAREHETMIWHGGWKYATDYDILRWFKPRSVFLFFGAGFHLPHTNSKTTVELEAGITPFDVRRKDQSLKPGTYPLWSFSMKLIELRITVSYYLFD